MSREENKFSAEQCSVKNNWFTSTETFKLTSLWFSELQLNSRKDSESMLTVVLGKTGVSLLTSLCPDYFVPHHQFGSQHAWKALKHSVGLHTPPKLILEATLAMATD